MNLPADFQRVLPLLAVAVIGLGAAVLVARGLGGGATSAQQVLDRALKEEPDSAALDVRTTMSISSPKTGLSRTVVDTLVSGAGADTASGKPAKGRFHFSERVAGSDPVLLDELSTGEQGFIQVDGRWFRLSDAQFKRVFEPDQSVESPGFDPLRWMRDPKSEGTTVVDRVDANQVSGDANVDAMLTDLGAFNGEAAGSPVGRQVVESLKAAPKQGTMDLLAGKQDGILRKLSVNGQIETTAGGVPLRATLSLTLALTDVNKPVTVKAPKGALPASALVQIPRADLGSQAADILDTPLQPSTDRAKQGNRRPSTRSYVFCVQSAKDLRALDRCQALLP